jgi:hypothetical protein
MSRGVIFSEKQTLRECQQHRKGVGGGSWGGGIIYFYIYIYHLSVQVYMSPNGTHGISPPSRQSYGPTQGSTSRPVMCTTPAEETVLHTAKKSDEILAAETTYLI